MSQPDLKLLPDTRRVGKFQVALVNGAHRLLLTPGLRAGDAEKVLAGLAMAMNIGTAYGIGEEVARRDGAEAGKAAMDARLKLAEDAMGVRP